MRRAFATAACLTGAVFLAAAAVRAQSFVGLGPVRSFTLPTEPRGEPLPAPASLAAPPVEASRPEAREQDGLRRLPSTQRGFRFAGEWAQTDWPIYLTAAQARQPAKFQLAFLSAISVMPEGSRITLTINDKVVARSLLAPPDAVAIRSFDIPAGLLAAGFNAVRLTVEQRHRVDCSPAATYELWTALDPTRTGLLFPAAGAYAAPEATADIAAIAPRADGAWPIRLLIAGKLSPETAGRALKAAEIAALASHMQHPVVEFVTAGRTEPGLELAIGTGEELQARPELGDLGMVAGPRFGFLPARAGRAPTFVVTGRTGAEIEHALARWNGERSEARSRSGSPAGLRALDNLSGYMGTGFVERIAFSQAGLISTEFSGRLLRQRLDVALPMDFLPADYDRMALNLAGSQGGGLSREASLTVEVNGHNAATQMLAPAAGELGRSQIFLPLSLMRPGQNRIEVVAQVSKPSDETCTTNANGETRLSILDRSELVLPRVARIGRAPELSLLAAGGYPFSREDAQPVLFVPTPDRASMAAAATLAAKLAVAAGRPLDFSFAMTPPAIGDNDVLVIAPAAGLDPAWLTGAGLDPDLVKTAWVATPAGKQAPLSEAEALQRRCTLPPARTLPAPIAAKVELTGLASLGLRASLPAMPFWQAPDQPGAGSPAEVVTGNTALLVGQNFVSPKMRSLWTLVTAPDAAALQAGVQCLTHPEIWSGLNGRISALGSDESLRFVPAGEQQRLMATQSFNLANLRLVAAAWLSLNPLVYVGIALALVVLLAGSTFWLVLNTGRRQE